MSRIPFRLIDQSNSINTWNAMLVMFHLVCAVGTYKRDIFLFCHQWSQQYIVIRTTNNFLGHDQLYNNIMTETAVWWWLGPFGELTNLSNGRNSDDYAFVFFIYLRWQHSTFVGIQPIATGCPTKTTGFKYVLLLPSSPPLG